MKDERVINTKYSNLYCIQSNSGEFQLQLKPENQKLQNVKNYHYGATVCNFSRTDVFEQKYFEQSVWTEVGKTTSSLCTASSDLIEQFTVCFQ